MASAVNIHTLGMNGKPRGLTRIYNGRLQQREHNSDAWRGAVRLSDVRDQLIRQAAAAGSYRFSPQAGADINDVTAFHPSNQQWGSDRPYRAPILFQLYKTAAQGVVPQDFMQHGGLFILDQDDHRIRNFPELPVTLSTALEGHDIELYRRQNDKIDYIDLIARMPASSTQRGKPNLPPPKPNSLQMRGKRFRLKAGCLSWVAREGSDELKTYLENLLGPLCVSQNSSRAFGRDLTKAEQDAWLAVNKGNHPERRRRTRRGAELGPEQSDEDVNENGSQASTEAGGSDGEDQTFHTDRLLTSSSSAPQKAAKKPESLQAKAEPAYPFLSIPRSSPTPATRSGTKRRRLSDLENEDSGRPVPKILRTSKRLARSTTTIEEPKRHTTCRRGVLVNVNREPGSRSSLLMWSRVFARLDAEEGDGE